MEAGRLEPRERQMRSEGTLFPRNALRLERAIDVARKRRQIRRGFQSHPKNARIVFAGKKSESAKVQIERFIRANRRKRVSNAVEFAWRNLSDELERQVKILRAYPARPFIRQARRQIAKVLDQCRQIVSHSGGNLQRDEKAHFQARFVGCLPLYRKWMRTISSAAWDACHRIDSRSPGKRTPRSLTPPACASATCTVPTGFSSEPPPGPAIPVIPTPNVLPTRRRIPSASAMATSALTAPLD